MKKICLFLGCVLISIPLVAQDKKENVEKVSSFIFPDYDEDGTLKSKVFGDVAVIRPNNKVQITNFKIEMYDEEIVDDKQKVKMRVTAPDCTYDKKSRSAESESSVRISGDKMIVTGSDFTWESSTERFQIRKDAKVVLMDIRKNMDGSEGKDDS